MRVLWVVVVLTLASACGRSAEDPPPVPDSPCEARFVQGEFGSNYAMTATLPHSPSVDEVATLTVGVCAKEPERAAVSIELPDGVEWRTPPEGTIVTPHPWRYGGCAETAAGQWDLPAMTPLRLSGTVVPTKAGTAVLEAHVQPADAADGVDLGNAASVAITVGTEPGESYFGFPEDFGHGSAAPATSLPVPVCG